MQGLMQDCPLLISTLIQHADRHHGAVEIVSRRIEGDLHRTTYSQLHARAKQLAKALDAWGVGEGQRVATLAWNGHRHMELYYAVAGKGAVVHARLQTAFSIPGECTEFRAIPRPYRRSRSTLRFCAPAN